MTWKIPGVGRLTLDPSATFADEPEEDEDEPTEEEQKKRHLLLIVLFRFTRTEALDYIDGLTDALADGKIGVQEWARLFRQEMPARHAEAWAVGRRMAGDMAPVTQDDLERGRQAWGAQEAYFSGFLSDVQEGRYSLKSEDEADALTEKVFAARASKYGDALGGTVHEAFRQTMGSDVIGWGLGDKLHCAPKEGFPYTCPELSELPPRPADEWDTAPKSSKQPCWNNCGCYWESVDGKYTTKGV